MRITMTQEYDDQGRLAFSERYQDGVLIERYTITHSNPATESSPKPLKAV